ncbi:MAG: DUF1573 domain-containing protein [Bacteroidaceae bacterium]|nr:DUF1573 domain-containing protein [Bacteroidaceae bacterium]
MTKKTLLVFSLLCFMFCIETSAKKFPVLKFEQTTIDFGELDPDNPQVTCVFKFTNVGKSKLIINQVKTTCGCTTADFTKDPISPGATGFITVKYDGTATRPGRIMKTIQIYSNAKEGMSRVFIRGELKSLPREQKHK